MLSHPMHSHRKFEVQRGAIIFGRSDLISVHIIFPKIIAFCEVFVLLLTHSIQVPIDLIDTYSMCLKVLYLLCKRHYCFTRN